MDNTPQVNTTPQVNYKSEREKIVAEILDSMDVSYEYSKHMTIGGRNLEIDFLIESRRLAIEVDGEHHFAREYIRTADEHTQLKKFAEQMERDRIKDSYFLELGWKPVLRIPFKIIDRHRIETLISDALGWNIKLKGIVDLIKVMESTQLSTDTIMCPIRLHNGSVINVTVPHAQIKSELNKLGETRPSQIILDINPTASLCSISVGGATLKTELESLHVDINIEKRYLHIN